MNRRKLEMNKKKYNRRDFLKHSAMGTVGSVVGMSSLTGCDFMKEAVIGTASFLFHWEEGVVNGVTPVEQITSDIFSTVSVVSSQKAVNNSGKINPEIAQKMFDKAIFDFTGENSVEAAWDKIIPGLKSTDTIGIKINCINPSLPSNPEVVSAIIDHLVKSGVKENNIMVWDRCDNSDMGGGSLTKSGYTLNSSDKGVKYISTSTDDIGYDDDETITVPSQKLEFPVSRILSKECKYLINVPQLRSHSRAGLTQCMKNFYGVIPLFDKLTLNAAYKMHHKNCNPIVPELYSNHIFLNKTKLHVCDSLMTVYKGGPWGNPQCILGKIMVGSDPVALDYLGLKTLEEERVKRGISSLMSYAKYVQTAAEMGLGTNNIKQMDIKQSSV
jgi:uncharacterized protein (DUF362 family)